MTGSSVHGGAHIPTRTRSRAYTPPSNTLAHTRSPYHSLQRKTMSITMTSGNPFTSQSLTGNPFRTTSPTHDYKDAVKTLSTHISRLTTITTALCSVLIAGAAYCAWTLYTSSNRTARRTTPDGLFDQCIALFRDATARIRGLFPTQPKADLLVVAKPDQERDPAGAAGSASQSPASGNPFEDDAEDDNGESEPASAAKVKSAAKSVEKDTSVVVIPSKGTSRALVTNSGTKDASAASSSSSFTSFASLASRQKPPAQSKPKQRTRLARWSSAGGTIGSDGQSSWTMTPLRPSMALVPAT